MSTVSRQEAMERGAPHYFTGKPCRRGHVADRFVSNFMCTECVKIHNDSSLVKRAEWGRRNQHKRRVWLRKYRSKNKVRVREWARSGYVRNGEKERARSTAWKTSHQNELRDYERRVRAANPERSRARTRNRKARLRNAEGTHTESDVVDLLTAQRHRCRCNADLRTTGYHVDHIIAITKGGRNDKSNLQVLCPRCNQRKGAKAMSDVAHILGWETAP